MDAEKSLDSMLDEGAYDTAITAGILGNDFSGNVVLGSKEPETAMRAAKLFQLTAMIAREVEYVCRQAGIDGDDFWKQLREEAESSPSNYEMYSRKENEE